MYEQLFMQGHEKRNGGEETSVKSIHLVQDAKVKCEKERKKD